MNLKAPKLSVSLVRTPIQVVGSWLFILIFCAFFSIQTRAQVSIPTLGSAYTENFNSTATTMQVGTASALLPPGFKIGPDWATGLTSTGQAAGTTGAVFTTGAAYNYANGDNASSTERALGFLSSGSYSSPKSIIFAFTNNTGSTVGSLSLSWNYEKYRSGTRQTDWFFFHGSTSAAATAEANGNLVNAADANSTTIFNPPASTARNVTISSLSIANGATYYLRWTYTGLAGSTSGQGLGIDDFSLTCNGSLSPSVSISGIGPAMGNLLAGSTNNVVYTDTFNVLNAPVTLNQVVVNLFGSFSSGTGSDISNLKLWYQSGSVLNTATATQLSTTVASPGPTATFSGLSHSIPTGRSHLFVTLDVPCSAFIGRDVIVQAPGSTSFTFAGGVTPTLNMALGGLQTLALAGPPANVANPAAASGNTQLSISWTPPAGCYDEVMVVATAAASITATPTGNGSLYTASGNYGTGTPIGNAFTIYKGNGTPIVISGLTNGTTYQIRIYTRKGTVWSSGADCSGTPSAPATPGDYRSRKSGRWSDNTTWETYSGGFWQPCSAGDYPRTSTASVTIRAGHVDSLDASPRLVRNLIVESGAKLLCGDPYNAGGQQNKYVSVYGNITCDGTIGNGALPDNICFNIDGTADTLRGAGNFSCNRIRKNTAVNSITQFVMDMNVKSYTPATFLYNDVTTAAVRFNVLLPAGRSLDLSSGGNIAIDGTNGIALGSDSYGTFRIQGSVVMDTLYLTTNNTLFSCWFVIDSTGSVTVNQIASPASGLGSHNLNMKSGALLRILSAGNCVFPFSATGNNFVLEAGSTIEYAGATAQNVEGGIPYANLTVSGGNTKTLNTNTTVAGIFTLASATTYSQTGLVTNLGNGGIVNGAGGQFDAGAAAGTVNFLSNGTLRGTTALTFNVLATNSGVVRDSLNNCNAQTLNLNGNGLFGIGALYQFNILNAGTVNGLGGNFVTGPDGGTLVFPATGLFTGTSSPYNVFISGGVDFGTGTTTIQNGGRLRINAGGSVNTNAPFYASGSTLEYNTGGNFFASGEWIAGVNGASGAVRGLPHHVQIGTSAVNSSKLIFSGTTFRQMNGDLFIGPATGGTGYALQLSNAGPGGDLRISGNWTRAESARALFNPVGRAVFFNGTGGNQTITILGGGTEVFAYLIVSKPSSQSLVLQSSPATSITVNGGAGGNTLQLTDGNFDLNGQTLNFNPFNGFVNNIGVDGTVANTTRRINSSLPGGVFSIYNGDNLNQRFTTVVRINPAISSLFVIGPGATLTIGGLSQNSGINFGAGISTILGTLQINTWGYVETNAPVYGNNSNLIYNPGGPYKRFLEWSSASGAGYPFNITVQNNTVLRVNDDNIPVNNNGNGTADRAMAGSFSIAQGSSVLMGDSTENNKITIGGNLLLNGTLTMPSSTTAIGADVYLAGNWNRGATGVFNHNERAVFFNGTTNATLTASGGQYLPYAYLQKNSAGNTLTLLDPLSIGRVLTLTTGTLVPGDKDVTLMSHATATARFGVMGAAASINYSATGRFVVERYLPTGTGSGQHGKSWQFLSVPTNGGQTVKQAWQEGAATPNANPAPGFGTMITGNFGGSAAGATALGFDAFTPAGPSVKFLSGGLWQGIPSTNTALHRPSGYMVFVRGDRSVTTFNAPAIPTTLRNRGKLFDNGANPPADLSFTATDSFISVGNPYASPIDFTAIDRSEAPSLDYGFWVWDPLRAGTNNLGGYVYLADDNPGGAWTPLTGNSANYPAGTPNRFIQSGQAFLMENSLNGAGALIFSEDIKADESRMVFRTPAPASNTILTASLAVQNVAGWEERDAAYVRFSPDYTNRLDPKDARKYLNTCENVGWVSEGRVLVRESRRMPRRDDTLRLFVNQLRPGSYRWTFHSRNLNLNGLTAYLTDRYLGQTRPMPVVDSGMYVFTVTSDPASSATDRFYLHFGGSVRQPLPANPASTDVLISKNKDTGPTFPGNWSVYPNPVENGLMGLQAPASAKGPVRMRLVTADGRRVWESMVQQIEGGQRRAFRVPLRTGGLYTLEIMPLDGAGEERIPVLFR